MSYNPANEAHWIEQYRAFADLYEVEKFDELVALYHVYDLICFLPATPTAEDKQVFNSLIGVTAESGYMDYQRSNNTFELIMQWQERRGNYDRHALSFRIANEPDKEP
ncbi:MAG: hypothetical protein RMJ87_03465 [Cytophagales bacterium]|nr:hypothetical protein [Bernardetiaceae bacterium]MDW8204066.1 hypothetical protein [Cytophagales bacterium]